MRNNKSLFILALLCAVAQGAWADEVTTQYANGVFTGFTATSGTGDNYQNLVDGNNGSEMLCTHGLEVSEVRQEGQMFELAEFRFKGTTMDKDKTAGRNPCGVLEPDGNRRHIQIPNNG